MFGQLQKLFGDLGVALQAGVAEQVRQADEEQKVGDDVEQPRRGDFAFERLHVHVYKVRNDQRSHGEDEDGQFFEADAAVVVHFADDEKVEQKVARRHDAEADEGGREHGQGREPHKFCQRI